MPSPGRGFAVPCSPSPLDVQPKESRHVPCRIPRSERVGPARAAATCAGPLASSPAPNEPERRPLHDYVIPDQARPGRTLHEPAARWTPNEPDPGNEAMVLAAGGGAASASKRTRKPLEIGG